MMPPQAMAIWAGAAGAAIVAGSAAALYLVQPSFLWPPSPQPASVSDRGASPSAPDASKAPAAAPTGLSSVPASPAAPVVVKPTFDVVNVDPTGEAVVAGRAAPNAKIELRDSGRIVAEAATDGAGQFVIIPPTLTPGSHSLTLTTGSNPTAAETSNAIPVAVPEPPPKAVPEPPPKAAVASATDSKPAATPTGPGEPGAKTLPSSAVSARIAVRSVEASAGGRLVARGVAEPNTTVRLYLSGAFVGDAKTKADGQWSLTIQHGMTPGAYAVRADEINPGDAAVVARAEAPFDFPAAPNTLVASVNTASSDAASEADLVLASVQTHHVAQGHTLWGISQKYYGDGSRYQLIFAANANQIKNPNMIYPGQMFVVPKPEPKP
jgi:nucleoid-associated protein YgaU